MPERASSSTRPGLTNGLTNGFTNGNRRGRVNGLGRTNGRTNGKTNGRTNGKTNGEGRTNGRTNGLTNGMTNGLINGGQGPGELVKSKRLARAKQALVTVALAILLMTTYANALNTAGPDTAFVIDGENDWEEVEWRAGPYPYAIENDERHYYLLLDELPRERFSFLQLFEIDGDPETGYMYGGLGVDVALRINVEPSRRFIDASLGTFQDRVYQRWDMAGFGASTPIHCGVGAYVECAIRWFQMGSQWNEPIQFVNVMILESNEKVEWGDGYRMDFSPGGYAERAFLPTEEVDGITLDGSDEEWGEEFNPDTDEERRIDLFGYRERHQNASTYYVEFDAGLFDGELPTGIFPVDTGEKEEVNDTGNRQESPRGVRRVVDGRDGLVAFSGNLMLAALGTGGVLIDVGIWNFEENVRLDDAYAVMANGTIELQTPPGYEIDGKVYAFNFDGSLMDMVGDGSGLRSISPMAFPTGEETWRTRSVLDSNDEVSYTQYYNATLGSMQPTDTAISSLTGCDPWTFNTTETPYVQWWRQTFNAGDAFRYSRDRNQTDALPTPCAGGERDWVIYDYLQVGYFNDTTSANLCLSNDQAVTGWMNNSGGTQERYLQYNASFVHDDGGCVAGGNWEIDTRFTPKWHSVKAEYFLNEAPPTQAGYDQFYIQLYVKYPRTDAGNDCFAGPSTEYCYLLYSDADDDGVEEDHTNDTVAWTTPNRITFYTWSESSTEDRMQVGFRFNDPYAVDDGGGRQTGSYRIDPTQNPEIVWLRIPYSWIQGAGTVYPITIDPTVIDSDAPADSTRYPMQRKVVRAGDVAGDTACDATNSDGCWYATYYDTYEQGAATETDYLRDTASGSLCTDSNKAMSTTAGSSQKSILASTQDTTSPYFGSRCWAIQNDAAADDFPADNWEVNVDGGDVTTVSELPSAKDTVASDTTTSATYEDVTGLSVSHVVDDTSDILLFAAVQVTGSTAAKGGWRLVYDSTNYLDLERQIDSEPGNVALVDRIASKAAGTYTYKLQHRTDGGTLTTANAIIVAVSLHDGTGAVPANSDYVASDTVGNAWEDIPGLSTTITLSATSHIWAAMVWNGYHSGNSKHSSSLINIDGVDMEIVDRHFDTGGEYGAVSMVTRTTTAKTAATYTVKGRWIGAAGSTLTGEDFQLVVIAAEAQSGSATIDIQKDVVTIDTTTATTIEDITGSSVTAALDGTSHVLAMMSLHTDVSVNAKSAYTTISIDGTDYDVMERGHANKNVHGSVGQVVRTDTALSSGSKTILGRWYTDSANTLEGEEIVLTSIVLSTVSATAATYNFGFYECDDLTTCGTRTTICESTAITIAANTDDQSFTCAGSAFTFNANYYIVFGIACNANCADKHTNILYDAAAATSGDTWVLYTVAAAATYDRVVIHRSSNVGGTTWGAQVILMSARSADSALLATRDGMNPTLAMDSSGYLHVAWMAADVLGDGTPDERVEYSKTTVTYPTQSEIASGGNWAAITVIRNTAGETYDYVGVATDISDDAHVVMMANDATNEHVKYTNEASGSFFAAIDIITEAASTSIKQPSLSVGADVKVHVAYASNVAVSSGDIYYEVCDDLLSSGCDLTADFNAWDGLSSRDNVDSSGSITLDYPSIASIQVDDDVIVVWAEAGGIESRYLDYPSTGWQTIQTVDPVGALSFTSASVGCDYAAECHAVYAESTGVDMYYKNRARGPSGAWDGSRTAQETDADWPSVMEKGLSDATYGLLMGYLFEDPTNSDTEFGTFVSDIPENVMLAIPIVIALVLIMRRRHRERR